MKILLSIIAGALWGLAAAWLNRCVTKYALRKVQLSEEGPANSMRLVVSNTLHLLVDVAAIASIYLLRNLLPMHYGAAIAAAAVALSLGTMLFSFLLAKSIQISVSEEPGKSA